MQFRGGNRNVTAGCSRDCGETAGNAGNAGNGRDVNNSS
jgi:hypothetical protein